MAKFEAIRFNPSPGEVVEMLSEAVVAANRRCRTRLLEDNPPKWRKAVRQYSKTPEGWEFWRAGRGGVPATQVMLSWWTDHIGRKHAVVRGRRITGDPSFLERSTLETRPALWHCYPDHLYLRTTEAGPQWIAVCPCGATGSPASLGWMGRSCGPCHDLHEERGESAFTRRMFESSADSIKHVAVSPDRQHVAAMDVEGRVHVWPVTDHASHSIRSEVNYLLTNNLGFSGNSLTLISNSLIRGFQHFGLNVSQWPPAEFPLTDVGQTPVTILPWSGGTFCRVFQDMLEWVEAATQITIRQMRVPLGQFWQAFPSHDFTRLAIRSGNLVTIIDPDDGQILVRPEIWDRDGFLYHQNMRMQLAFSPDYRLIAIGLHNRLHLLDGVSGRSIKHFIPSDHPFQTVRGTTQITSVGFDHTGETVLVGTTKGAIIAYRSCDWSPRAVFRWHLGNRQAFAMSADGTIVVTGDDNGIVKLWPIDRLMASICTEL